MRKLRIALLTLFAMVLSLALFACNKSSEQIDTIEVNRDPSITLTDADNEQAARKYLDDNFVFTATYENSEDREIPASEYKVDWSGVAFGTTGNYTATVTTTKDNKYNASVSIAVTIDHAFGAADSDGMQVCSKCSAVSQTKTINDSFAIAAWGGGVTLGKANEYVKTDARLGNATSIVARLDKGMSIKLKGEGKSTGTGSTYFYPILGVANIEEGGSVIQRNDNWTIYDSMQSMLSAWSGKPYSNQDATLLNGAAYDPATADLYRVYVEGDISSSSDYFIDGGAKTLPVELTWEYREDNVFVMTWNNPTLNRVRIAYVKLPDRQYYNAVLHGEQFSATFTEVQIVQKLKLQTVGEPTVKSDIKKVLENKYIDSSIIDIDVTYAGGKSEKAGSGMLTVYGNDETVTALPEDNVAQGGMSYNGDHTPWTDLTTPGASAKMSTLYKSFKVRVQTGNDWFEKLLPAAEAAKISGAVVKNAVDHGNSNDVTIGETTFVATGLTQLDFVQTDDNKTGVVIAGTAATLTTAQASALNLGSGSGKHYIAFTLYADGMTHFEGTPTIEGTKGAVNVAADHLDVVLAVAAGVEKVTIKGVNGGTDIVVTFGEILGYTTTSTLSFTTLKLNETKDLTVTYDISGVSGITDVNAAAENLGLTVNGVSKTIVAKNGALDLNNKKVTGLDGFEIKSIEWKTNELKVVYTIPKFNPAKPTSYTLNLINPKTGVTLASDKIFYEAAFAAGNDVVGDYYVVADGNSLYLSKAITGTDIRSTISEELHVMVNKGAQTDEEHKLYTYLQNHDLAYFLDENGNTVFTNMGLLSGFAEGKITVFGTLNNSEDTDHGAVIVIELDVSQVGINGKKDNYYFAINNDLENTHTYNAVTYDAETKVSTVGAAQSYTLPDHTVNLTTGNCLDSSDVAYEIGGSGDSTKFYAFANYTYSDHQWVKQGETNVYKCSVCGSERNYNGKEYVDANNVTLPAIGNVAETGMTVTFELQGTGGSDWGAAAVVTGQGNMIITLPNLDPWNNSVNAPIMNADDPDTEDVDESKTVQFAQVENPTDREKALGQRLSGTNLFPTANNTSYLKNGGAWDSFLSGYWYVTISISKENGIQYYRNGTLLIDYPANAAMGSSNVGEFAELFLLLSRTGITIGRAGVTVKNATVYPKAVDAAQAIDLYLAYEKEVGVPTMPGPSKLPAMPTIQDTWTEDVTVGTDGTVEGTDWKGYSVGKTWYIKAGQKIVVSGVLKANKRFTNADGNLDGNWYGIGVIFDRGLLQDGVIPLNGRMDNYINGVPANNFWKVDMVPAAVDAKGEPISDWVAEMAALREGANTAEYTFDFTDPTKLVCTIKVTGAEGNEGHVGNVFTQSYTITALPDIKYQDGSNFKLEDWALVGLAVDSGYLTGTATCTYTAPKA